MSDSSAVEIKFCDRQLVVFPSAKLINRRKSAKRISSEVSAALERRPRDFPMTDVVMDLSNVGWLSSAGLNELIRLQAQSRASGIKFRLRSTSETVREVFRITRLERTFQFDSDASEKFLEESLAD